MEDLTQAQELREIGLGLMRIGMKTIWEAAIRSHIRPRINCPRELLPGVMMEAGIKQIREGRELLDRSKEWAAEERGRITNLIELG